MPTFSPGETRTATLRVTNPTTQAWDFDLSLHISSEGPVSWRGWIAPDEVKEVVYTISMPLIAGDKAVWLQITELSTGFDLGRVDFAPVTIVAPPSPADFAVTSFEVRPSVVLAGARVEVWVGVKNNGGTEGVYTVTLVVGGRTLRLDTPPIPPGNWAYPAVIFGLTFATAGSYPFTVDGRTGTVVVSAPPPMPVATAVLSVPGGRLPIPLSEILAIARSWPAGGTLEEKRAWWLHSPTPIQRAGALVTQPFGDAHVSLAAAPLLNQNRVQLRADGVRGNRTAIITPSGVTFTDTVSWPGGAKYQVGASAITLVGMDVAVPDLAISIRAIRFVMLAWPTSPLVAPTWKISYAIPGNYGAWGVVTRIGLREAPDGGWIEEGLDGAAASFPATTITIEEV